MPGDLKAEAFAWKKKSIASIKQYYDHKRLDDKYQLAESEGALLKPFDTEARAQWQWLRSYMDRAEAIDTVPADMTFAEELMHGDNVYTVDASFLAMRRRHAKEAQSFVAKHHSATILWLEQQVQPQLEVGRRPREDPRVSKDGA